MTPADAVFASSVNGIWHRVGSNSRTASAIAIMAPAFSGRDFVLGLVAGAIVLPLLVIILFFIVLRNSDFYGVDHWKLNMRTPFPSMWMNLGYWKRADGSAIEYFDEACCALLHRILDLSGALSIKVTDKDRPSSNGSLAIIDLGFGCGDQTWELARLAQSNGRRTFRYVGLTLNEAQMQTASRRIQRELATMPDNVSGLELDSFKLFCANAAKPDSWSPTIRSAVDAVAEEKFTDRWVLALDCLYHFSPSRKPIFTYAAQKLDAQFMAFDLILNDNATTWDKILARAGCFMMGCPLFTFLTEKQYKDQLVASGYDRSLITIQDISDDVFQGVTRYLERQERGLAQYGVSMGGFKLAGRIFGWYDKSRVVKASIVVARIKPKVS